MDWNKAFEPLIAQYRGKRHPLDYQNRYQLVVMVVLSARDSDKHINALAPALFAAFPTMADLARATPEALTPYIDSVTGWDRKVGFLLSLAQAVGADDAIPTTMAGLVKLSGVGRKSANVILRESKLPAEGIIVDLHVVRVAPRLGIAVGDNPEKIEKQMMAVLDRETWGEAGMAVSFLGREICRPTRPNCGACVMNPVCGFEGKTPVSR
ncbi:MAG TPA: endonuclease III [Spirochaetia bacterium]|jgi:endonuclease-3|nr:endonuclease III [Spirochaetia bacterium]